MWSKPLIDLCLCQRDQFLKADAFHLNLKQINKVFAEYPDIFVVPLKSFLLKFALTTQTAITGLGLALSGTDKIYEGIQADITAAEEVGKKLTIDYASRFDFSQKLTVSMMMFAIPPILCIIALIIFNKKYRLYGDLEKKVNEFVVEKHKNDIVDKRDKLTQIVEKVNEDIRSGE